jgi:competence ComEA-like helix-hairpin-helix protein
MKKVMTVIFILLCFGLGGFEEALSNQIQKHMGSVKTIHTLVNINVVDAKQLKEGVKGMGKVKAEAIVAYRHVHGPFKSLDDLTKVRVKNRLLGSTFLKRIRSQLTV